MLTCIINEEDQQILSVNASQNSKVWNSKFTLLCAIKTISSRELLGQESRTNFQTYNFNSLVYRRISKWRPSALPDRKTWKEKGKLIEENFLSLESLSLPRSSPWLYRASSLLLSILQCFTISLAMLRELVRVDLEMNWQTNLSV